MTRADLYGGLLLAAFFAAALWEASTFQYGTEFSPGPGFAPVWLSAVGLCVSLLIVAHGLRAMRPREGAERKAPSLEKSGLVRVGLTLFGFAAMVLLVEPLGLALAILLYLLFLTVIVQRHSLVVAVGTSVGTVVFVYLVFVRFLEVPIPKGPLGL
ncbi:MAG: tripartite tricarboxylate transporter TctB family protein [Burkholderiales bacterium]